MPSRRTLLIVDQSLRDGAGHHFEYDVAVVAAATARGLRTVVGANVRLGELDVGAERVHAWFCHTWLEANQSRSTRWALLAIDRVPAVLRRSAVRLGSAVRAAIRRVAGGVAQGPPPSPFGGEVIALVRHERLGPDDHVLIHTLSVPELDSLIDAATGEAELPAIHVVLRRDADEPMVRDGPRGGIRGSFARLAAVPTAARRFRFHTDTEQLAAQYAALAGGARIDVLPIPHCLGPAGADGVARAPGPLRLVYLGDARREKGFHHLPAVVAALAGEAAPRRARFILQANTNAFGTDRDIEGARAWLARRPNDEVELIDAPLGVAAFQQLLASADIVLLPYDAAAYRCRSSGILIQAVAMGRPVVVPAGTWLSDQVDPAAAVTFATPADLPAAVRTAIDGWRELSTAAQSRRAVIIERHSSARFVSELMDDHLEFAN